MCGRFVLKSPVKPWLQQFGIDFQLSLSPRFNIAPTQQVLTVRHRLASEGFEAVSARWGLTQAQHDRGPLINARVETVETLPVFRDALQRRRCLIPADGFYEWKKVGGGKQPHYIRPASGDLIVFAGLWEAEADGEACTIITTAANESMLPLHNRMSVILHPHDYDRWLDPGRGAEEVAPLLATFQAELMTDARVDRGFERGQ